MTARRWTAALVPLVAIALVSGCGGSKAHEVRSHGIVLVYPKGWSRLRQTSMTAQRGTELWSELVGPAKKTTDLVILSAYDTPVAITSANASRYADEVKGAIASLALRAGGRLLSGPSPVTMGGFPGYGFVTTALSDQTLVESRLVLVWKGKTEYFLNCQYDPTGTGKTEIERGCKTIIASFKTA